MDPSPMPVARAVVFCASDLETYVKCVTFDDEEQPPTMKNSKKIGKDTSESPMVTTLFQTAPISTPVTSPVAKMTLITCAR
mmetsp:Transcript_53988/g.94136  ORF Transcript_53988/g.94136 Transcript_53988/m.94136 type:complete len:81 (-) Transcript_53988:268-510(-)